MTKQSTSENKAVVLLHGIGRSSSVMKYLGRALTEQNYTILNIDYESTEKTIEDIVKDLQQKLKTANVNQYDHVDFVGHSMGGVVIRELLRDTPPENLGRVVMIGSPNGGSEIADTIKDWKIFKLLLGPAGQQLTTEFQKAASKDLTVEYPLGIISSADNTGYFWVRTLIPSDNDGLVSVESTKLKGMDDHVIMPAPHITMPFLPSVIKQVVHFLKHGKFNYNRLPKPKSQGPAPK